MGNGPRAKKCSEQIIIGRRLGSGFVTIKRRG